TRAALGPVAGAVSPEVLSLVADSLKAIAMGKAKTLLPVLCLAGLLVAGAGAIYQPIRDSSSAASEPIEVNKPVGGRDDLADVDPQPARDDERLQGEWQALEGAWNGDTA